MAKVTVHVPSFDYTFEDINATDESDVFDNDEVVEKIQELAFEKAEIKDAEYDDDDDDFESDDKVE